MPIGRNRVLGNPDLNEAARPHRVGIASWPTSPDEPRTRTLDALLGHIVAAGYEGVEFHPESLRRYFPTASSGEIASRARRAIEKAGLKVFGSALHLGDDAMRQLNYIDAQRDKMQLILDMGGEYATYQVFIHPDYLHTGGIYREDERYLKWCAEQVELLRGAAWDLGLNFYLEVHVDRITEDPHALCRILEMCTCELNGDLSHLLARGMTRGKYVERIQKLVGHAHVRMARMYGDLSADIPDPATDWANRGATWQMFRIMKPALEGGLSSRALMGETGPMHLVKDTLSLDAKLVPLYRAMARYGDASAQGIAMKVEEPGDLKPWG